MRKNPLFPLASPQLKTKRRARAVWLGLGRQNKGRIRGETPHESSRASNVSRDCVGTCRLGSADRAEKMPPFLTLITLCARREGCTPACPAPSFVPWFLRPKTRPETATARLFQFLKLVLGVGTLLACRDLANPSPSDPPPPSPGRTPLLPIALPVLHPPLVGIRLPVPLVVAREDHRVAHERLPAPEPLLLRHAFIVRHCSCFVSPTWQDTTGGGRRRPATRTTG